MRRKAFAKATLFLAAEKLENGELIYDNVTVPLDLFDMIDIERSDKTMVLSNHSFLPNTKGNTVYRAIELMKERYQISDHFKVTIMKNIPAQSGLGGGSADAACVINLLNEEYELGLSREALIDIAKDIDEDTAFCLFNEAALVQGKGDIITPIAMNMEPYYVLIKPHFGNSTKSFLKRYEKAEERTKQSLDCRIALEEGSLESLCKATHNDFEKVLAKKQRKLKNVHRDLEAMGLKGVVMSGSGTSMIGFCEDLDTALRIHEKCFYLYPFVKYGRLRSKEYDKMSIGG